VDIEVVNRVMLSRNLLQLALDAQKSSNDKNLFAAVNLLQDSVEAFLLAVSDHVHAAIDQNTKFDKYFDSIDQKIAPKALPFRNKLIRLNKLRVNSKHFGIQPERGECSRLFVVVREFFEEVSATVLQSKYATLSVIDLLDDVSEKEHLVAARAAIECGDFSVCAIECRKALFLLLAREFDVSVYREGAKPRGLAALTIGPYSRSPRYACSKEYIRDYVKDPTDYVVLDHDAIERDLSKYSVDSTAFWNVWRLTPEVWQDDDGRWVVRYDFDKVDRGHLESKIDYIFSTTTDIVYAVLLKKSQLRSADYEQYSIELKEREIPVYAKADSTSTVLVQIPAEVRSVNCDYCVDGFSAGERYWFVHYRDGIRYFYGYVADEDVSFGAPK